MSALPSIPPVTQRVIRKPLYRNENIHRYDLWYRDNEPALVQYWEDLRDFSPDPDMDQQETERQEADQEEFFASQYECALEQLRLDSQATDDDAPMRDTGWSPYDRDTGIPKYGPI